MDIVIKSYNRAYLLDRVLNSIYRHVVNGLGKIVVLDDGTPKVFLDKIKEKYPDIIIKYSPNYNAKIKGEKFGAPVQFWREEIQKVSKEFLLLEDDIWLTENVDLNKVEQCMLEENIKFFRLTWWGNEKKISGDLQLQGKYFGTVKNIRLPFASETLVKNRYFTHSLLIVLRLMPKNYFIQMYTLYDVAGHVFNRDYYCHVWPSDQDRVEEMIQLGRSAEYFRKNKTFQVGRMAKESAATTFLSSSSGSKEKLGFDMDLLNLYFNEEWLDGNMDVLQNFPSDFTLDYLNSLLERKGMDAQSINNWRKWSKDWRSHFIEIGSDLSVYNNTNELK